MARYIWRWSTQFKSYYNWSYLKYTQVATQTNLTTSSFHAIKNDIMNLRPDNSPNRTNYHVVHQVKNEIKGTTGPLPDNPFDQLSNRSSRRVSTLGPLLNLLHVPCNSLLLHCRLSSFDDNLNDTYGFLINVKRAQ